MQILKDLISNHALIAPIIAWAVSQFFKCFVNVMKVRKFSFKQIFSEGGMPSAHTATVVSVAVMCGWISGFSSPAFAIAAILSAVIMRDAVGVRYDSGKHARKIKEISEKLNESAASEDEQIRTDGLKLVAGHTVAQVVAGAAVGIGVSVLYIIIAF